MTLSHGLALEQSDIEIYMMSPLMILQQCIYASANYFSFELEYSLDLSCRSEQVQLFIYFMLKYAMEVLLAESSVITAYYFIWSTRNVAIFLACLGLTVLPVNVIVGSYLSNIFEER